ncbi:MAG: RtcB family protein, partial [Candidatus Sumerlaeia bacterium]|nr:RtcB family protein [Candidatus Sumerlaeia bacterium]
IPTVEQLHLPKALESISKGAMRDALARAGVELLGGGRDEAPQAYKSIDEVMAAQRDLVDILGVFWPRLVLMSGDETGRDI